MRDLCGSKSKFHILYGACGFGCTHFFNERSRMKERETPIGTEKNRFTPTDEEFEECIRLLKSAREDDPIFLNEEKTLKMTITDGDYTLREGVDYKTVYCRGYDDSATSWSAISKGMGKYEKMLLKGCEFRFPPDREKTLAEVAAMVQAELEKEENNA